MQRCSPLNSLIGLKGALPVKLEIVEFNPPPGMSNNGKPEPASSKWSLPGLLSKYARRCGHCCRRGARCQYAASVRFHNSPQTLLKIIGLGPTRPYRHAVGRGT